MVHRGISMWGKCIVVSLCLVFTSCGSLRVFQEEVPSPIKKTEIHKNEERKGAYYLALNTTEENQLVANALSRSLGTPTEVENNAEIISETLFKQTSTHEQNLYGLNTKLDKLQGKQIKDTGLNVMPWFSGLGFIVVIVLLVLFPSLITVLFFVLKRTRSALGNIVTGIKEFSESDPSNAKDLHELLEKKLDRVEKNLKFKMENHG